MLTTFFDQRVPSLGDRRMLKLQQAAFHGQRSQAFAKHFGELKKLGRAVGVSRAVTDQQDAVGYAAGDRNAGHGVRTSSTLGVVAGRCLLRLQTPTIIQIRGFGASRCAASFGPYDFAIELGLRLENANTRDPVVTFQ